MPPNSPIVFVASFEQDRLVLPWERNQVASTPYESEGEALEFQSNDPAAAATRYRRELNSAKTPAARCEARLRLGRATLKAGKLEDSRSNDRIMLRECATISDADGVSLSLYAAQRILAAEPDHAEAGKAVLDAVNTPRWRQPNEAYMLKSLLTVMPTGKAALQRLATEIRDMEQVTALAQNIHDPLGKLQRAFRSAPGDLSWMGYGDEPWLITMLSPGSFATPVVMGVSSRKLIPVDVSLHARAVPSAMPLGDGFVDIHLQWAGDRFARPQGVPVLVYASTLVLILGAALLAAHLLLRDLHREAQTAEMRSHFVASVSHELKTPLTAIQAVTETLLLDRADPEARRDYLETIHNESARLTRLVDNVLDFSRIEQGRKSYHMQSTCLAEVVRSAIKAMEYPLTQLGFTLTVSGDDESFRLNGDPDALKQALLNLIGNAMKYSGQARRIEIHHGSRNGEAFVDVVDHGIGISREDQGRIFEKFHRVHSVETQGIAGTGLGLSLALHVVEAHKGRIEVSSDIGQGSTFSIRIPLQAQA